MWPQYGYQELQAPQSIDRANLDFRRLRRHLNVRQQLPKSFGTQVSLQVIASVPLDDVGQDIVLFHVLMPSREAERRALPLVLDRLAEAGYRFASVSELLSLPQTVK